MVVSEDQFTYESIGIIRTPFESPDGMPIQPVGNAAEEGIIKLKEAYAGGIKDLDGFSHCILLYHFHASDDAALLEVEPFLDDEPRGVFATRAPQRPNPIGLSVVEIESITDGNVTVNGIDVVDQTPLLDIKPFVPKFDVPSDTDTGWLTASKSTIQSKQADERFVR